jgi:hypothetical protein
LESFKNNLLRADLTLLGTHFQANYVLNFGRNRFFPEILNPENNFFFGTKHHLPVIISDLLRSKQYEQAFCAFFEGVLVCFYHLKEISQVLQLQVLYQINFNAYLSYYLK